MANGVQLATAYISLNVDTRNVKKQIDAAFKGSHATAAGMSMGHQLSQGLKNAFGGGTMSKLLFAPIELAGVRWAAKAGAAIGGALKKAILGAASLTGVGSIFAVGGVLMAGLERLKTMQASQVQLSLKLNPQEIKDLQKQISDIVTGTPINLDQAMAAIPKAINRGLRGSDAAQYVKDIADLTASTGSVENFDRLAIVMDQIAGKGKLAGEEVLQLVDAGVDINGMLKDAFHWDDKTLQKNMKANKVGIDQVRKAIQLTFGAVDNGANKQKGLAQRMGQTFEGAVGALKASAARLGANFIAAILGKEASDDPLKDYAEGINKLTDSLKGVEKWVHDNRETIHDVFVGAGNAIKGTVTAVKSVAEWLKKAWDVGNQIGERIASGFGKATDAIDAFISKIQTIWTNLKTWVVDKWNAVFGPDSPIGKFMDWIGVGPTGTANAATGTTAFNPGPRASGAAGNRLSVGAAQGLPAVGMPSQSLTGAPIYNGPHTENTGGAVQPRTAYAEQVIKSLFPGVNVGNDYRLPDGFNEHSSGEAADFMISQLGQKTPEGLALGDQINQYLLDHAKELGLQYTIWRGQEWYPGGGTSPNSGQGVTGGHWDHVHGRFNPGQIDPTSIPQPVQGKPWTGTAQASQPGGQPNQRTWLDDLLGVGSYASGGGVRGAGSSGSDSIPAMLSNGEHVLTADDVKAMGGQKGVYAFRAALQAGLIPGFDIGGAVDPNQLQDLQNQLEDLNQKALVAQTQYNEVMNNPDASDAEKLRASINMQQAQRAAGQAAANYPIIASGGTPPDTSLQDQIYSTTDQLALAQQALKDLPDDALASQRMQAEYGVKSAERDRTQAINAATNQPSYLDQFLRSAGFMPAQASSSGVAGTSSLASVINMGSDVVGGLIDTGTSLAKTAVSAAITAGAAAGTFGGAAPAAPAASAAAGYGIDLLGNIGKRSADYWFGMAGIGADALIEQMFPFGAPRWLGYDYTNFAPQLGITQAATSTLEAMGKDAINKAFQPGGFNIPAKPGDGANTNPSGPTAGSFGMTTPNPLANLNAGAPADISGSFNVSPYDYNNPTGAGGGGGGGSWGDDYVVFDPNNPTGAGGGGGGSSYRRGGAVIGVYDNGGVLMPGQLSLNASKTPEAILTKQQWNAIAESASTTSDKQPLVGNLYAQDMQDAIRQLQKVQSRNMMQYAGRS